MVSSLLGPFVLEKIESFLEITSGPETYAISLAIWNGTIHNLYMKMTISMDPAGRLVIPKSVRQALNVPERAVFEAEVLGNRIELTLTEGPKAKLRRKGKLLIVPRQGVVSDAVKAVEATRRERI